MKPSFPRNTVLSKLESTKGLRIGRGNSILELVNGTTVAKAAPGWPIQAWIGVVLLAICWPLNWTLPGLRTAYLFFPLWLGYIFVVDGLMVRRTGSSLWRRSHRDFVLLFVASSPIWWIFEIINHRTANWEYQGSHTFTPLEYYMLCTLSFSTVMPAVFETAELVRTFRWVEAVRTGPSVRPTPRLNAGIFLTGLAMFALTLAWPNYFYPFVWISLVLILEPINRWLGRRNFLQVLGQGDWRPIISLSLGALICGFFWEMWNYYSWPKWIYHTPGAQFLHVFEMPLLGYLGYIPFALELFALKNFIWPKSPRLSL